MVIQVLLQAMKSLVCFLIGVWRRALCCFRRRRRLSNDSIPLTAIGIVPTNYTKPTELENWSTWEPNYKQPNTVQEQIELYRQQKVAAQRQQSIESVDEPQQDFFEDMTPRISRQMKVMINNYEDEELQNKNLNRLALAPEPIFTPEGELGEWDENSGWEKQTESDWDPQSILREKRKQERERRIWEQQEQRKQDKVVRPLSLGAKISS